MIHKIILNTLVSVSFLFASSEKNPSVFGVDQQQGPTCPWIPFKNLQKIQHIRERENGEVVFNADDYHTKIQSYASFLPSMVVLDQGYETLRAQQGPYAEYEANLRQRGIQEHERYTVKGKPIEKMDRWPTDTARRVNYTPYHYKHEDHPTAHRRWMPLLAQAGDDHLYFYDYRDQSITPLGLSLASDFNQNTDKYLWRNNNGQFYRFTPTMLAAMGLEGMDFQSKQIANGGPFLGSSESFFLLPSQNDLYNRQYTYLVGTYHHMLFGFGLNRNNESFNPDDAEYDAYMNFREVMDSDARNPWYQMNREDFLEYHLTTLFKNNAELKDMAQHAVNFYNNPWSYYLESKNFRDKNGESFANKADILPSDDQMLAYFFSSQVRFLWAASIGMDALIAVEELDEELTPMMVKFLKRFGKLPGIPSPSKIIKKALKRQYPLENGQRYSFMDTYEIIKQHLPQDKKDFITFSGHGTVISFDENLVNAQQAERHDILERLGFVFFESLYEKGIHPFYQQEGNEKDLITLPIQSHL